MNTKEILTVNDLINELQKFNGNQKIMMSIEDEYCYKIDSICEAPMYNYEEDISEEEINKREKIVFIESNE